MSFKKVVIALHKAVEDAAALQDKADQLPTDDLRAQTALLSLRIATLTRLVELEG